MARKGNPRGAVPAPFRQCQYVVGHALHDPPVLHLVPVPVVHVGDPALAVVLDPVHRVAAEAEPGYGAAVGAPQVVRRDLVLYIEFLAYIAHREADVARRASALPGEDEAGTRSSYDRLHRLREPNAVGLPVLGAGPSNLWIRRAGHSPPPVGNVLVAHVGDFAGALTRQEQCFERAADALIAEGRPECGNLGVAEYSFPPLGGVSLHSSTRVAAHHFLGNAPREHR